MLLAQSKREYIEEDENTESVCRVAGSTAHTNIPDTLTRASEEDVLHHVKQLFKHGVENLRCEKKAYIAGFLVKYQDSFQK